MSAGLLRRGGVVAASVVLVAAMAPPAAATVSPERPAGSDVGVTRITHGARQVAPGQSVLLGVTLTNRGDTATATPLRLTFPDLPAGVTLTPPKGDPPGLSCEATHCEYESPIAPDRITPVHLVADIAPNVATGPVDFDVRAEVPGDPAGPDDADSVSFRVSDQAPSRPRLALTLRPESEAVAGHRTTFQAQLINVAGATARRAKVARVIEQRVGSTINARGTNWDCTPAARSTCRYNRPLPWGRQHRR